jgi:hypothetical protein
VADERSIANLEAMVNRLPDEDRARFERIFSVTTDTAHLVVPAPIASFVESRLGSPDAVSHQTVVKVTNLITLDGTMFNPLREKRPEDTANMSAKASIEGQCADDPFSEPLEQTTEDTFGRVRGAHCVTAANLVPFDRFHAIVIFDQFNPLEFTEEKIVDAIDTALAWARLAHSEDQAARYFFLFWNCLWRAGASRIHGHLQATLGKGMHYAQVEALRRAAVLYRVGYGVNYFDDLCAVHRSLGLATSTGAITTLASLAPKKEKEVWVVAPRLDDAFKRALFQTLRGYVQDLGVESFNMALLWKPIDSVPEDWSDFPVIARLVDRGDLSNRVSDIASMELFGSSVVSSDPFAVARVLQRALG